MEIIKCPHCGKEILSSQNSCFHCGFNLSSKENSSSFKAEEISYSKQTSFTVYLRDVGRNKIGVIKEICTLTRCGIAEGKRIADTNGIIISNVSKDQADSIIERFKKVGAIVDVK